MNGRTALQFSLLAAALAGPAMAQATYEIDTAHSTVEFSVRHMMITNVKGVFNKVTGTFFYDPKNPSASNVEATVDANTVNTREPKRDAHLKTADFFDTAKYPAISFKSKQVWKEGDGLRIKGDLTMRGVTREVVFSVDGPTQEITDQRGSARIGASASTKINRKDWGLTYGGALLGDQITVTLDIQGVRKSASASE